MLEVDASVDDRDVDINLFAGAVETDLRVVVSENPLNTSWRLLGVNRHLTVRLDRGDPWCSRQHSSSLRRHRHREPLESMFVHKTDPTAEAEARGPSGLRRRVGARLEHDDVRRHLWRRLGRRRGPHTGEGHTGRSEKCGETATRHRKLRLVKVT